MAGKAKPIVARFLSRVYLPADRSKCWIWLGSKLRHGYGAFRMPVATHDGKLYTAHRASWFIHNGPVPTGKFVLHKCDVKSCVNPDHLYLGDHAQNMKDARDRLRAHYGIEDGMAKFSKETIDAVRAANGSCRKIAKEFGMSNQHVSKIRRGEARIYA